MEQPFSQENCIQSGEVLFLDIIMAKTYIENDVMINLISSGLNGTELSVVLFLIRKTNGWHKETDEISLSQFLKHIPVTKPTLCKAIKNLQLVKIIKLVKKGKSLKSSNEYKLEKNISNWQLVKKAKLVKFTKRTSKDFDNQLVKKPLHTKETITKETIQKKYSPTSEEVRLSTLLLDLILDRKANFRKPDIQKWSLHIDRLLHIGKRTPQEIEKVIHWCQQDDFWQDNILSTEKLRKQIDKLELKMNKPNNNKGENYGKIKRHSEPYPEGTPFDE